MARKQKIDKLTSSVVKVIKGLPFISTEFDANSLFTLTLLKRQSLDPTISLNLSDYSETEIARQIYASNAVCRPPHFDFNNLDRTSAYQVSSAIEDIKKKIPSWNLLLSLPVDFYYLTDQRPSSTSALIPQTIFLGKNAFINDDVLKETLIHEFSHTWLNLIIEIKDLMNTGKPLQYTLPSGTSGKNARGVLYAAHFSASAISYYQHLQRRSKRVNVNRINYLCLYLDECLKLIKNGNDLTSMGFYVLDELKQYSYLLK